jgi:hypothetical protein
VFPKIPLLSSCNHRFPAGTGIAAVAARFVFTLSFRVVDWDIS